MRGSGERKSRRAVVGKEEDIVVALRKVIKYGNCLCITLPREWIKKHGIKPGDELVLVGGSILRIIPPEEEVSFKEVD